MTTEKYKTLINTSGEFIKDVERGDRPQPVSKEDKPALTKIWKKSLCGYFRVCKNSSMEFTLN